MDTSIKVGEKLMLSVKTLSAHKPTIVWEADLGKGWVTIPKVATKDFVIKKAKEGHTGNYRCSVNGVASRVAKVQVEEVQLTENDESLENLEGTSESVEAIESTETETTSPETETSTEAPTE
ncbi:MAG: hypothetical protein HRU12_10130 [Phaeodactylibacter sp.]|nr:hypothetical protein [Phaeodactylibacter sp.]